MLRIACVYALLDRSGEVRVAHLRAALALWRYSAASARTLFGESLGDPLLDELARLLQGAGSVGLTRTELRDAFGRHRSKGVARGCDYLASTGLVRVVEEPSTGGRRASRLVWVVPPRIEEQIDALLRDQKPATKATRVLEHGEPVLERATEATKVLDAGISHAKPATEATEVGAGKNAPPDGATEATKVPDDPFACLADFGRFGRAEEGGLFPAPPRPRRTKWEH